MSSNLFFLTPQQLSPDNNVRASDDRGRSLVELLMRDFQPGITAARTAGYYPTASMWIYQQQPDLKFGWNRQTKTEGVDLSAAFPMSHLRMPWSDDQDDKAALSLVLASAFLEAGFSLPLSQKKPHIVQLGVTTAPLSRPADGEAILGWYVAVLEVA